VSNGAAETLTENTVRRFGETWLSNWRENWPRLKGLPGIKRWFGRFEGVPALVVNAGPSLEKDLAEIWEYRDRFLTICVDRAYPRMLAGGVSPHVTISLDSSEVVAGWFADRERGDLTCVVPWQSPRLIQAVPMRDTVPYTEWNPDVSIWRDIAEESFGSRDAQAQFDYFGALLPGGTVGNVACDLAVKMGCDPVIFVGLDLCYRITADEFGNRRAETIPAFDAARAWYEDEFFPTFKKRYVNCSGSSTLRRGCELKRFSEAAKEMALSEPRNFAWELRRRLRP